MGTRNSYKDGVVRRMNNLAHLAYGFTKRFPREERYGLTSQLRRSVLSVVLNYVEGYARKRPAVQLNFLEMSYGSLKEAKYLLHFSLEEGCLGENDYNIAIELAEELGTILWTEIKALEKRVKT